MKHENYEFIADEEIAYEFPRVKNWLNAYLFPKDYEVPYGESETVPDQSMSMREILSRYARGLPVSAGMREDAYYDEDSQFPDTKGMDLAELQELRMQYSEELNQVKRRIADAAAKKVFDEKEAYKESIIENFKKSQHEKDNSKKSLGDV